VPVSCWGNAVVAVYPTTPLYLDFWVTNTIDLVFRDFWFNGKLEDK